MKALSISCLEFPNITQIHHKSQVARNFFVHSLPRAEQRMSWRYPSTASTYIDIGLSGGICLPSPDAIPHHPLLSSQEKHPDIVGINTKSVPTLQFRNLQAYPYHDPYNARIKSEVHKSNPDPYADFVEKFNLYGGRRTVWPLMKEAQRNPHNPMELQGNTMAWSSWKDGYLVFYPTGKILDRCTAMYYEPLESIDQETITNGISIVNVVKQVEIYSHFTHSNPIAVVRGASTGTFIALSEERIANELTIEKLHTEHFSSFLAHMCCSPYAHDLETTFITDEGKVYNWTATESSSCVVDSIQEDNSAWEKCEYSNHPRVLWLSNKFSICNLDLRSRLNTESNGSLSGWVYSLKDEETEIYSIQRHPSNPYQVAISTESAIEIIDSRWADESVICWSHGSSQKRGQFNGSIDILPMDENSYLVATSSFPMRKTTVRAYGFPEVTDDTHYSLRPIRHKGSANMRKLSSAVSLDVPLDIPLPDQSREVFLSGMCHIPVRNSSKEEISVVFQCSSLGDVYSQSIVRQDNDHNDPKGTQNKLRVGFSSSEDHGADVELPVQSEAFLRERDDQIVSLGDILEVSAVANEVENQAESPIQSGRQELFDWLEAFKHKLLSLVTPSCTLEHLRESIKKKYGGAVPRPVLLEYLCASKDVRVRFDSTLRTPTSFRLQPHSTQNYRVPWENSVCTCEAGVASIPCHSSSCIVPFSAVIVPVDRPEVNQFEDRELGDYKYIIDDLQVEYDVDD